jgi:antitoxin MazE
LRIALTDESLHGNYFVVTVRKEDDMAAIRTSVIKIGNSRGIRIPKAILEQCRLDGEVELRTEGDQLVVGPSRKPRQDWDEAFRTMAERGDDAMVEGDVLVETGWERDEWHRSHDNQRATVSIAGTPDFSKAEGPDCSRPNPHHR